MTAIILKQTANMLTHKYQFITNWGRYKNVNTTLGTQNQLMDFVRDAD